MWQATRHNNLVLGFIFCFLFYGNNYLFLFLVPRVSCLGFGVGAGKVRTACFKMS